MDLRNESSLHISMRYLLFVFFILLIPTFPLVTAEVWIPEKEFAGYFDSDNIYTVVGVVRNTEDYSVLPTIEIAINESGRKTLITQQLPAVFSNKDIPFKLKAPEVTSRDVVLEKPIVSFEKINKQHPPVEVIYDHTLKRHEDGHQSGRIINNGNKTVYDLKVYATIHGANNKFIDVGKSIETIEKIEPGQILEFTIYPDPSLAPQVSYYSCFAIGDPTIVPLVASRDGENFEFRYDSTASFTVVGFDKSGTQLTLEGINSFKLLTYVNFEFPQTTDNEQFDVIVNDEDIEFVQSLDEMGSWHVAFDVAPASQYTIVINGFEKQQSGDLATNELETAGQTGGSDESMVGIDRTVLSYLVGGAIAASVVGVLLYRRQTRKITT